MQSLVASFLAPSFFRDFPYARVGQAPYEKEALSGPLSMILLPTDLGKPDGGLGPQTAVSLW
jgi:hypothetical protein